MKEAMVNDKCWLSIAIGIFGCFCLFRAAICSYFFYSFSADKYKQYMAYDLVLKIENMQDLMIFSIIAFTLVASISIVSAIGIFLNKTWATKV